MADALLHSTVKAEVARLYADHFDLTTLIETGTGHAVLTQAAADYFDTVVTIEADLDAFTASKALLEPYPNVTVHHGDSAALLTEVLREVDEPCVIFLDAHEDIEGGTSALAAEMKAVSVDRHDHVVLIDDVRLCNGWNGWETPEGLKGYADLWGYHFEVVDDIARLTP